MNWLKLYWLKLEGFDRQFKGWWINTSEGILVDKRTIDNDFYNFYRGRVKSIKYGKYTWYSHKKLNLDVLDTLKHDLFHNGGEK